MRSWRAAVLAAATAFAATLLSGRRGMDSHKLPNVLEAALPPHIRSTKSWWHGRFDNPWPTWEERSFKDVLRWNRERRAAGIPSDGWLTGNVSPSATDYAAAFPAQPVDWAALASPPEDAVQALWVGHSSVLVQMEGVTFLTDPIFSERCSPISFMGPKRCVPPALTADSPGLARLPPLDFVLISHNHYDHLDKPSVQALHKRYGDALVWYVPLGLGSWFRQRGISSVVELDWWQTASHQRQASSAAASSGSSSSGGGAAKAGSPAAEARVEVTFTPAQHWSMRSPWSRKASLWGSFAVAGPRRRFWFGGDSGYCPVFQEIGMRLGPFDLAAVPIGAYEPRWFMKPQHVNPEEAVLIHREVRSARSMAIHHATFALTNEAMDEPARRLPQAAEAAGLTPGEFVALRHGAVIATRGGQDLNALALLQPVPAQPAGGVQGSGQGIAQPGLRQQPPL